jgi:hypothetical protein
MKKILKNDVSKLGFATYKNENNLNFLRLGVISSFEPDEEEEEVETGDTSGGKGG